MTKLYVFAACFCFAALMDMTANAQAFRKGSLLISVSEGATFANYKTVNYAANDGDVLRQNTNGDRDPLTLEYGLTNRWGIGINMGGDILHVDPATLYNIKSNGKKSDVTMSECTVDANYHYFVTKRTDVSAFASAGIADVTFKGKDGDVDYKYAAGGGIWRAGTKIKYYVFKRVGVMCMVSAYSATYSPQGVRQNNIAVDYDTKIKGFAIEFGLCTRLLK